MITATDATLAQLSLAAYDPNPELPFGFTAVPSQAVSGLDATAAYRNGVFTDGNSAALVTTGLVDGVNSLVIAFRGTDDREDALNDLTGINADYADFADLIAWADAFAASGAVSRVVVTGHSLGGSLAQQFMATHPDGTNGVTYAATTFGSPGAQLAAAPDARIENVVIADDPAVVLGTHRGELGAILRADPELAAAAAEQIAREFPDVTAAEVLATLPTLTANYLNRGEITLLPGADGQLGPNGLYALDAERHDPDLYATLTAAAASGAVPTEAVPATPIDQADAYQLGLYGGQYPTGVDVGGTIADLADAWAVAIGIEDDADGVLDDAAGTVTEVADVATAVGNEFDLF